MKSRKHLKLAGTDVRDVYDSGYIVPKYDTRIKHPKLFSRNQVTVALFIGYA